MGVEDLARGAAAELEAELGENLSETTDKVMSGELEETRGILGTTAEIVTIATFLVSVSKFAWDRFQSMKNRADLTEMLENEFADVPVLDEDKRRKIIDKIIARLFS